MPKPLKKRPRRPTDPNQWAHQLVKESTEEAERQPASIAEFKAHLSAYMAQLGQKGGRKGGKRRLVTMTPEERSAVALKAARSRWNKAKAAKKHV